MKINLSHGNGGRETSKLIDELFMKYFRNEKNKIMEDAAVLDVSNKIAFTTDSFIVKPIFFKGGDIGKLAICGTVNDLLTRGAVPKYLSASFIIEEGLDTSDLEKIVISMEESAIEAGVMIVTGDTKVIDGSGGLYINTSGIGELNKPPFSIENVKAQDVIIVTGNLGDHHSAIISSRLGIENDIMSDVTPLNEMVFNLMDENIDIHCMRDITRGGLATVLNEISKSCSKEVNLFEKDIPVLEEVKGLCKILGLDPLYMGNEGKMLIIVSKEHEDKAINIIRRSKYGRNCAVVGEIREGNRVILNTRLGGRRIIGELTGEGLPRIC
ncbi:MAG: hydrogenase expression/formation protein HypE [Oscillospiraceae bacterium]|nr:hydrogenase expression/formation protein HypE [Oscillospiraceae bacterium]